MKKILLLSALLFSNQAFSEVLTWADLEPNNKYTVATDIQITEDITLKADSPLYYRDLIAGQIPVMIFSFENPNCTNPEFETDIALFNPEPEDQDHDKSIGIQFSKNCMVDVYVEPYYYYDKSIFAE